MLGKAEKPAADWNVFDNTLDEAPGVAKEATLINQKPPDKPIDFVAVIYKSEVVLLS